MSRKRHKQKKKKEVEMINDEVSQEEEIVEEQEKTDSDASVSESEEKLESEEQEKADSDTSVSELEKKLESAEQEAKENYDRLLRVSAEFENYKKRSARELETFKKFAIENLIKALLPVADNLELAISSSVQQTDTEQPILEGVRMTLNELLKIFEKFGVTPIEALEKEFDPNFHEAAVMEESDDYPANTVLRELQKGYMIHERLLRPAMVVVSKAKQ